jgi:type II secretory pathway pseudopilin PulG
MISRPAGFSLIELIVVIVVLMIAAAAIGSAFAYISRSLALNADLQGAAQIAQECAEHIVGLGRKPGSYAAVPVGATACNAIATPAGYTRTVNVTAMGTGGALCSGAGWGCKRVDITVTRGSATAGANFMLVNY